MIFKGRFFIKSIIVIHFIFFSSIALGALGPTFIVNTTDDTSDVAPGNGSALDINGNTSLRAAIEEAEANGSSADTIGFASTLVANGDATIKLSLYDPGTDSWDFGPSAFQITTTITITGPSGDNGIILERSGNDPFRLFFVTNPGDLTVNYLTFENGLAQGGNGGSTNAAGGGGAAGLGGAFLNSGGTLNINNCTLFNNHAVGGYGGGGSNAAGGGGGGGGVAADGNNQSGDNGGAGGGPNSGAGGTSGDKNGTNGGLGGGGGGAWGNDWCPCTLTGGNGGIGGSYGGGGGGGSVHATGGGMAAYGGDGGAGGFGGGGGAGGGATSGNTTEEAGSGGAGGFGAGAGGNGTANNSNPPSGAGGGGAGMGGAVFNRYGTINISNTTFSGNSATGGDSGSSGTGNGGAGSGLGGAIFNVLGTVNLRHVTVTDTTIAAGQTNGAAGSPNGAVYNLGYATYGDSTITINNSIIANTTGGSDFISTDIYSGTDITSGVGNLIENSSGFLGSVVTSADPVLSVLADNRGPTQTHAIGSGSPALDTADSGQTGGLSTDQRGGIFNRVSDGDLNGSALPDIGAYEHALIDYGDAPDYVTGTGAASIMLATGSDDFRISSMGSDGDTNFAAFNAKSAYNATDNEFFVVWQADDDTGSLVDNENEIYGQRIKGNGALVGSRLRISTMASDGDGNFDANNPAVAWNSTTNQYLVVWQADDNTGSLVDGEMEIYGQLVSATASNVGGRLRLTTIGTDGSTTYGPSNPEVVYNNTSNEFLVVWQGDDPSSADGKFEIYGQRINSSGGLAGSSFLIGSMSGDADYDAYDPAVAWNSSSNGYLVVWRADNDSGSLADNENEIYGRRVTSAGAVTGAGIRISTMGTDGDTNSSAQSPAIAFNTLDNEYLVVWRGDENVAPLVDGENEIFGQRLSSAGSLTGSRFQISNAGDPGVAAIDASSPSVAFDGNNGTYLVTWQADHILDNKNDIFGRRVSRTGTLLESSDIAISEMGANSEDADFNAGTSVTNFNSTDGTFFVTWQSDDSTGSMVDGETEIFGQLLESESIIDYKTRGAENGPSHRMSASLRMGAAVDSESDGQPSLDSDGDDTAGSTPDDEDGLASTSVSASAPSVDVIVTNSSGSAATLYGWIDYDGDGQFENATERASTSVANGTSGTVSLNFPAVPGGYTADTMARFRLSTDSAAANATGLASDGEVEDYAVTISVCQASAVSINGPVTYSSTTSVSSGTSITTSGTVTVSSSGDVTYTAPVITLSPGFSAAAGSDFNAKAQSVSCP